MKRRLFYLSTCSTCTRIIKEIKPDNSFILQDIKSERITEEQLNEMISLSGSAESLFSRKAMKYRSLGLNKKELNEADYKRLILEEYTFLKRPVFIIDGEIFIGNSKANIEAVAQKLSN